ncbi:MAG: Clp protease ClpP [Nitrosomonas sp.]|nr:Clp protease ClpP [Nitrosomonas sp.]
MASKYRNLAPGTWRVNKTSDQNAEVFLYGDIGGWMDGISADEFAREVSELDVSIIDVRLNSGGGSVFEGQAIYNALNRHPAKIIMNIDGIAASIASVIAMAGDQINITEGSHVMIHKPWSMAMGDAESMRKEADVLDSLESGIIDIYAARTGKDRKSLEKWVNAETWFKGQAAVDAGFADAVIPAKRKEKAAKSNILALYAHTPDFLLENDENVPNAREIERILRDVEGFSVKQAKRIAGLVCTGGQDCRDGDDGFTVDQANKLAEFIKNLTKR